MVLEPPLYQWQSFNGSTWDDIAGANASTYSTLLSTAGDYTYRLQVTQDAGCVTVSNEVTVTVVTDPAVSVSADDQSICEGGTVQFTASVSGGAGTSSYQWQFNNSGTWEDISGATALNYSTALLNAGTFEYRVVVTQNSGCSTTSDPLAVNVVADPIATVSADDTGICEGGTVTLSSVISGGTGTTSYQWQYNNPGTGWTNIGGATGATYDVTLLNAGDFEYRLQITQDEGCDATSNSVTINVVADPVVTIAVDDTEICNGGSAAFTSTVTGGNGANNYQWQIFSGTWQNIPGATAATFNTPALAVGTYQYRLQVSQDAGCLGISNDITVTVVADPVVSVSADDLSICDGGVATLSTTVTGGTGTTTYQWQYNDPIDGWEDIPGATSDSYVTPALGVGPHQYRVNVDQDNGCSVTSTVLTVNVVADPTVSVSSDFTDICDGGLANLTAVVSGGAGTTNYQWEYNDPIDGWEIIPGETNAIFTTSVLAIGTYEYRVSITQDQGCENQSAPIVINVVPDPVVAISAADEVICAGGSVEINSTITGGAGSPSYQWQYNDPVDGWEDISGETGTSYTTPTLAEGSYSYRLIASQNTGCNDTSSIVTITAVGDPTVSVVADDEEICEGGTAVLTATVTGGTGNTFYQWQTNSGGPWADISGAVNSVYSVALVERGLI